jgi:hypothetical protein
MIWQCTGRGTLDTNAGFRGPGAGLGRCGDSAVIDAGLRASIGGNRYHGDPDRFGVDNPQMKYSLTTVGPKVQIHFTERLHLNLEGGYTIFRNFSFFDGPTEASNFDMENAFCLRASTVIGM